LSANILEKLNKILVIVGIAIVAVGKVLILKFTLVDQPSYERCLSSATSDLLTPTLACGSNPFIYFMIGWVIVAVGAVVLILGLKADDMKTKISR
jgi:hypothetical protein